MFARIKNSFQYFQYHLGYTRYARIEHYINTVEQRFTISDKDDRKIVEELDCLIRDRLKRLKRLYLLNFFLFLGAYFSLFSFFFSDIVLLEKVTAVLKAIVSFVGTTVFIIALFVTRRFTELYYQDLNLLTAHFISVYTKSKLSEGSLFGDGNMYEYFIDFFKHRPYDNKRTS